MSTSRWITALLLSSILLGCQKDNFAAVESYDLPQIRLHIGHQAMQQIQRKRREALALGLLESSKADFVNCTLSTNDSTYQGEVRLKGDWLDHLRGSQWSWRVKLTAGAVLGMRQFSLQHPRTRSYLQEWVYHQLLAQEGILTPRYTFVQLWLNDEYKGVYALEEHFTSDLLAHYEVPESVIMKYDETGFWQTQNYRLRYGKNVAPSLPVFQAAPIDCFQGGRTRQSDRLRTLYTGAQRQMEALRNTTDTLLAPTVIDYDYWARFYALTDLVEAYHALRWHNMRFYYHPLTGQLLPIGFDGYGAKGIVRWFRKPFLGAVPDGRPEIYFAEEYFLHKAFNSSAFIALYAQYLHQYTQDHFVKKAFEQMNAKLRQYQDILATAYAIPAYSQQKVLARAAQLRATLSNYDFKQAPFRYTIYEPLFAECPTTVPLSAIGLKAYLFSDKNKVLLRNYYCQDIQIEATGPKRNKPLHELDQHLSLPAFKMAAEAPPTLTLTLPADDRYLFYSIEGVDYWFRTKIDVVNTFPSRDFSSSPVTYDTQIFTLQDDTLLVVPPGKHLISTHQFLPANRQVQLQPGAALDLANGAAIFAAGPFTAQGTDRHPIRIFSSDGTGQGVHFLASTSRADLAHVHFQKLRTYCSPERWLNGVVSVHSRPFNIQHCTFTNLSAEDGLNIVACDSLVASSLVFHNTTGDAVDIDFSSGRLEDIQIYNSEGDGVDISGSQLQLSNIQVKNAGDKGLSIGEASHLSAQGVVVNGAYTGLAIKDGSNAMVAGITLDNCVFGLAAFRKKATYPGGTLRVENLAFKNIGQEHFASEPPFCIINSQDTVINNYASGALARLFYPVE